MKILIVNNNTQHLDYLLDSLAGHEVEVVNYHPGIKLDDADKDLVILSGGGGEGLEIHDRSKRGKLWYKPQMEFVRKSDKPILGICMGFEVIAKAFGAPVKQMRGGFVHGYYMLTPTPLGRLVLEKDQLMQFKAHNWHVPKAPKDFEVLATSPEGIEIIKHKKRPVMAVQFHPEKGGSLNVQQLAHFVR